MENKSVEFALEAGIAIWAKDNQVIVKKALNLGAETTSLGLWDTDVNPFMQIVPKDMFGPNGNLVHECFLNINHQAWGYYRIIVEGHEYRIIEPKLARSQVTDVILLTDAEAIGYVRELAEALDPHYKMYELLEEKNYKAAEEILNEMLTFYKIKMIDPLKEIKSSIDNFSGELSIKATNSDDMQLVKELNTRYDLALLHPENWIVTKDFGVNGQEWLYKALKDFQILENKAASLLYYAQKIIKNDFPVKLIVHTDSKEPESDLTGEVTKDEALNLVLVRPVIHATRFEIKE